MFSRLPRIFFAALISAFVTIQTANAQFRIVALDGDVAPGTGLTFSQFDRPVINGNGLVAFLAEIDSFNNFGIWSERTGTLGNVMLGGTVAPGSTFNFDAAGFIAFNDNGHTLFRGGLESYDFDLIWSDRSGTLAAVVAPGQSVPNSSQFFRGASHLAANSSGHTAFLGSTNPIPASGIYSEGTGTLVSIVETNTSTFSALGVPVINNNGHIAFKADNLGANGIYTNRSGSLATAAMQGHAAPGGGTLSTLFRNDVALNNAGDIAFKNLLTGATHNGLFVADSGGTLREIARTGDAAPGTSTTFTDNSLILASVFLDGFGKAIFHAEQLANGDNGIFRETSSGLELIVKTGDLAPGTGNQFTNIVGFSASENGHVAFLAEYDNANFDEGIWLLNSNNALVNIVKPGDLIEVASGDFREVEFVSLLTLDLSNYGSQGAVNNLGQVAFEASFLDGTSGVFVSNAYAVPEPVAAFPVLVMGLALVLRRHRNWQQRY